MRGETNFMVSDVATALPHVKAGKLRALAISTQARSPLVPDLPSMSEVGYPGFDMVLWIGVSGPAGMPRPIADRLNGAFTKILANPELTRRYAAIGMQPTPVSSAEFERFVQTDLAPVFRTP